MPPSHENLLTRMGDFRKDLVRVGCLLPGYPGTHAGGTPECLTSERGAVHDHAPAKGCAVAVLAYSLRPHACLLDQRAKPICRYAPCASGPSRPRRIQSTRHRV